MNRRWYNRVTKTTGVVFLVLFCQALNGQNILNKNLSISVSHQRLGDVLEIMSNKGNFYFSYNSSIIKSDSIVSLSANNRTVKEILDGLLGAGFEYKESGNYLIIRRPPIKVTLVTNKAVTEDKFYIVTGYVLDNETGYMLPNASVYEKNMLASALTNQRGYFQVRLKSKTPTAALTVSKEFYEDTTVVIEPRYNQQISIAIMPVSADERVTVIRPEDYFTPDSLKVTFENKAEAVNSVYTDSSAVERTGMGRFLLSSRQRAQALNLEKFFTDRPVQVSITPGLSTHGRMSPQVVNNFSLNVFGGYSGGVNGAELGGLFNIDKKEVKAFQAAGLFNIVGGELYGVQLGGINNTVLDSVRGFQAAGINNHVAGSFTGFQVAGVYNHVAEGFDGVQVAGVGNYARTKITGTQVAGVVNFANRGIKGAQIAGVVNYAKKLNGLQIGLINVADSSDGYSIGLLNIVVNGYHKLSFSTDEFVNTNAALKTGTNRFYSILQAGLNWGNSDKKVYTFGYGLGTDLALGRHFSINPEIACQYLYLGAWDYTNLLNRFRLNLDIKLGRFVTLFGGPVFNVYYSNQTIAYAGFKAPVPPSNYHSFDFNSKVTGWIGWNAGINFF